MTRLSPELERFFAGKGVDVEKLSSEGMKLPFHKPTLAPRKCPPTKEDKGGSPKIGSILNYVLGFKELRSAEKLILIAAVDAHVRQTLYQARVRKICGLASCSRATVFRSLNRLAPKWLEKVSRPGKSNLLKPSRLLLRYLGLAPKKGKGRWNKPRVKVSK